MEIKNGGAISNLKRGQKIRNISFNNRENYIFEMWINGDCLSYLSLEEMLALRDEIHDKIGQSIKKF